MGPTELPSHQTNTQEIPGWYESASNEVKDAWDKMTEIRLKRDKNPDDPSIPRLQALAREAIQKIRSDDPLHSLITRVSAGLVRTRVGDDAYDLRQERSETILNISQTLSSYLSNIAKIETRASGSKELLTNKGAIELLISLKRTDLEMMLAAYESKNPPDPRYNHLPLIIAARHLLKTELGYVSDPETWELRKAPEEK